MCDPKLQTQDKECSIRQSGSGVRLSFQATRLARAIPSGPHVAIILHTCLLSKGRTRTHAIVLTKTGVELTFMMIEESCCSSENRARTRCLLEGGDPVKSAKMFQSISMAEDLMENLLTRI